MAAPHFRTSSPGRGRSPAGRLRAVASIVLLAASSLVVAQQAPSAGAQPEGGGFFQDLLHVYTPRRVCMENDATVIGLHVVADLLIALSYFSIPVALVVFVRRRRDLAFNWMFLLFASFIFACGLTHLIGVWSIWEPLYKVDGIVKLLTGLLSMATAVLLWRLIPSAVALPSPADLASANAALAKARDELEARVATRTNELVLAGERERAARADAERANRAKDQFLAMLSHELRTPLNSIVGWAHLLTQGGLESGDKEKGVAVIARNARIQAQLIDDMLDMSRIVSGKMRLDVQDVDPTAAIEAALETVEPAASAKGIRLHRVLDPRAGPVRGDPDRMQQVIWNLLSNAVKFTPRDGRVSVVLELINSHIEISVTDTGPGIAPDLLPYVFDRFRQDDSSATRRQGGLGLGLAIVRHLVELHGGTVDVSNVAGGSGAVFTIRLPRIPATQTPERPRAHPTAPGSEKSPEAWPPLRALDGLQLLVVDDEPDARDLVATLLVQAGATVRTAASAAEALEQAARLQPDVLISDIGMPDEDGLSLLRTLRQKPASQGGTIPALALTAFARPEDRRLSLLAGFQMHLAKPVDSAELVLAVASLAGRRLVP